MTVCYYCGRRYAEKGATHVNLDEESREREAQNWLAGWYKEWRSRGEPSFRSHRLPAWNGVDWSGTIVPTIKRAVSIETREELRDMREESRRKRMRLVEPPRADIFFNPQKGGAGTGSYVLARCIEARMESYQRDKPRARFYGTVDLPEGPVLCGLQDYGLPSLLRAFVQPVDSSGKLLEGSDAKGASFFRLKPEYGGDTAFIFLFARGPNPKSKEGYQTIERFLAKSRPELFDEIGKALPDFHPLKSGSSELLFHCPRPEKGESVELSGDSDIPF